MSQYAVDGDPFTSKYLSTITAAGAHAWLLVDLEQEYLVKNVQIIPGDWDHGACVVKRDSQFMLTIRYHVFEVYLRKK